MSNYYTYNKTVRLWVRIMNPIAFLKAVRIGRPASKGSCVPSRSIAIYQVVPETSLSVREWVLRLLCFVRLLIQIAGRCVCYLPQAACELLWCVSWSTMKFETTNISLKTKTNQFITLRILCFVKHLCLIKVKISVLLWCKVVSSRLRLSNLEQRLFI